MQSVTHFPPANMALSVGRPTRLALATLALLALALLALVTSPGLPAALLGARAGRGLAERGGGRGAALTEKLENVFSAPLDAITGFFTKVHSLLRVPISVESRQHFSTMDGGTAIRF